MAATPESRTTKPKPEPAPLRVNGKAAPVGNAAKPPAPPRKPETVSEGATTRKLSPPPKPRAKPQSAPARPPARATTRRSTASRRSGPHFSFAIPLDLQREIIAVLVCLFAVLTAIGLNASGTSGILGVWGGFLNQVFGAAAWLVPLAIGAAGVLLFVAGIRRIERLRWEMPLGIALIVLAVVGLMHMGVPRADKQAVGEAGQFGGLVGYTVSILTESLAGTLGGTAILLALALVGAMMAFHLSISDLLRGLGRGGHWLLDMARSEEPESAPPGGITLTTPRRGRLSAEADGLPTDLPQLNPKGGGAAGEPANPRILGAIPLPNTPVGKPEAETKPAVPAAPPAPIVTGKHDATQLSLPLPGRTGMIWKLPDMGLLERATEVEINDGDLMLKARKIEECLRTFNVGARVREINSGPAVTQFALEPDEGIRVAKIVGLANDLALALAAPSIRIEAPVPGMARVGVEVPNVTLALVGLRNILETPAFQNGRGKLKLPIGRDTHGQPVVTDMTKLPHLLIAGATGSGKSVAINALIVSFMMQYTPDQLRMLMVDPKRVELSGFNGIPHLLRPVVTEMKSEKEGGKGPQPLTAIQVLKWLIWEMERRYKIFAKGSKDAEGVSRIFRNIDQYHTAATLDPAMDPMPYIVLIIDELADLMLVAPEDVETALCRLAQLARATGIHLVIATQRPSVDVVTGLIKANFPARIAFAVTSMIDSRVILDTPGAEKLLGRGDALYTASDESKPIRVQGTFLSDKETERVVNFWRKQLPEAAPAADGAPDGASPLHGPLATPGGPALAGQAVQLGAAVPMPDWLTQAEAGEGPGDDEDAMLKQAIELVKKHNYASTSMLQRRLRIGYNRAARLVEEMETLGLVGPAEGSRSRPVLMEREESVTITPAAGGAARNGADE
ncbi:MAG: DNA translocase FtsK 4TM domain-containing protein [Chloroflexota bacterium]|nr:DNA translocase FtsK 4TM domain-containing protein [Chloroflexota bacterium]